MLPSRGGIGKRLKKQRTKFTMNMVEQILLKYNSKFSGNIESLSYKRNAIIAKIKFTKGPANPTRILSLLGFLNRKWFYGTGFAKPNIGALIRYNPIGRSSPSKLICFNGLNENLPKSFAVGSPK